MRTLYRKGMRQMLNETYFLSLDLGTQGTKAALVTMGGEVVCSAFSENVYTEKDDGEISIPAEELSDGVLRATKMLLKKSGAEASSIAGIAVVAMMAGIVGIDEDWNPVMPYDSGLDKRCESAIEEMQAMGEERIIQLSGCPVIVAQGAKIYWWKENHPEIFAKVKKMIPASTYVSGRMAGLKAEDAYIDYTHIHLTNMADTKNCRWSEELLEQFGIPMDVMPKIVAPFDKIGGVSDRWAALSGLKEGTPIMAGCGDTAASCLGAGLVKSNMALDVAGTASVITACVEEYRPDTEKKILLYPKSVIPGLWTPFGFVLGGQDMSWYHDQVNYDGGMSFDALSRETAEVENDGLFFIPFFAGRICPSDAGFSGHWIGMKFYHGRAHMFKSIMESIGYEYRFYLKRIQEMFPRMEVKEVFTSAGGARSEAFTQVKADVLNLPFVQLLQKDTSHKAAAIIAGYGTGIFRDMAETAIKMSEDHRGAVFTPDQEKAEKYRGQYEKYQELIDYIGIMHRKKIC